MTKERIVVPFSEKRNLRKTSFGSGKNQEFSCDQKQVDRDVSKLRGTVKNGTGYKKRRGDREED